MVEINWDRVCQNPTAFVRGLLRASSAICGELCYRLLNRRDGIKSSLSSATRHILCNALLGADHLFIMGPTNRALKETSAVASHNIIACHPTDSTDTAEFDIVILYCHGGGFRIGDPLQNWDLYRRWIRKGAVHGQKVAVFAAQYPLGPENPYPAAVNAVIRAYKYLLHTLNTNPNTIFIAGDSAGGNLAAAFQLALRSIALPLPGGAILLSPWLDLTLTKTSRSPFQARDPLVNTAYMRQHLVPVLAGSKFAPDDWQISPTFANSVEGLPPQFVVYGDAEVLQQDARDWVALCRGCGVDVTVHVGPGGLHSFATGGLLCDRFLEADSDNALFEFLLNTLKQR